MLAKPLGSLARMSAGPHVVLVGLPGSGKTTVAALVAERLGWPVTDLDADVERRAGRSVAEVFAGEGEAGFRRRETRALLDALASEPPAVIAAGGGVVTVAANRVVLADGRAVVCWLDAPLDALVARVGAGDGRPLLADDGADRLAELARERRPWYVEVAHVAVDAGGDDPSAVADAVLAAFWHLKDANSAISRCQNASGWS